MSDAPTQSAAPDSSTQAGYLTLSPFVQSRLGWCLMGWDCQVRSMQLLQDGDDDAFRTACGALS